MYVSGFTFIRNALKYDFPVVEAITSILPLCDEFVVAVGRSDDQTRALIEAIDPAKIRIVDTVWDEDLRDNGRVLAVETDKAFRAISPQANWAFYIQGDEVLHQKYLPAVKEAMQRWQHTPAVDGLLFKYNHFYGSYNYVGNSPGWYRNEVRVVRNDPNFYSYRDAQGFRKFDNQKLSVKQIDATMYHYGYVRDPRALEGKIQYLHKFWFGQENTTAAALPTDGFDYGKIDSLARFDGTHPAVMQARIERQNWHFEHDISYQNLSLKHRVKLFFERYFGWLPGEYKNYKKV